MQSIRGFLMHRHRHHYCPCLRHSPRHCQYCPCPRPCPIHIHRHCHCHLVTPWPPVPLFRLVVASLCRLCHGVNVGGCIVVICIVARCLGGSVIICVIVRHLHSIVVVCVDVCIIVCIDRRLHRCQLLCRRLHRWGAGVGESLLCPLYLCVGGKMV
jgi:hypothetical protein